MKILIVDDKEENRYFLENLLKGFGYEVNSAVNGKDALKKLRIESFNMIISDILMPEMDGFQLLKNVKADNNLSNIPFVFYTATYTSEKDREFGLKLGVDEYLQKPIDPEKFIKIIQGIIRNAELGELKPKKPAIEKEEEVLKLYSERLVRKLEKKMMDLEREVIERKRAEKELKESEEKFRSIFESLPDIFYRTDAEWNITLISPSVYSLGGYKPEEVIGKPVTDFYKNPEDHLNLTKQLLKTGKVDDYEITLMFKGGKAKIASLSGYVLRNSTGLNIGFEGVLRDITERKKVEEASRKQTQDLKKSEASLAEAQHIAHIGSWDLDLISNKLTWSDEVYRIFGLEPHQIGITYEFFLDNVHPDDREVVNKAYTESVKNKIPYNIDHRIRLKDGTVKYVNEQCETLYNEVGKPIRSTGTIQDITERKETEKELIKLSTAVKQSPVSIVITDTKGNIEYVNPKFSETTGYTFKEALGQNSRILKSGEKSSEEYKELWDTITSGKEWRGEFHNKKKNGKLHWESALISPITDKDGKITNFLAVKEDITERKIMEENLIKAKDKAEESNRLKSHFLALMSHELRTPMAGILGYAEILQNEIKDPELKEFAEGIYSSGSRLTDTLNSILNLSSLEVSKQKIYLSNINFERRITKLVNTLRYFAKQKNITLNIVGSLQPLISRVDKTMFDIVIVNLVNNAIKYTEEGIVTIRFHKEKENSKDWIVIKVEDTGIGIPDDKLDLIFEEFRQVDEGMGRNFEGVGLGLSITKKYVERMNGQISVESKSRSGSTFTVKLPYYPVEEEKEVSEKVVVEKEKLKIPDEYPLPEVLLVEDDDTNIHVTKLFLRNVCKINIAKDGKTALKLAGQTNFSAILMDINLGKGLTGIETTKEIRKIPGYENTPIVALTAYAMVGDKEQFLKEGCTHYLEKPFSKDQIIGLMNEIFENN